MDSGVLPGRQDLWGVCDAHAAAGDVRRPC
jgi:hypothetical protein